MDKIGLMGGTFNPIHNAHLQMAQECLEAFGLDRILFIPAGQPYMNKDMGDVLSATERAYMTRLGIEGNPAFEFCDLELNREGISYTCDTLNQLITNSPDDMYYILVGGDSFMDMEKWKHSSFLFHNAVIGVSYRSTVAEDKILATKKHYEEDLLAKVRINQMLTLEISSSDIRRRVREGKDIRYLVPQAVADYIEEKNLYR
ncbi:MAG: nicotinate-nucleotide adenylyltransferase [Lachnospiraceae bacterium]|nr:nicotinate-nucleotide adenylyltransferase [Lachnospiraceae bacterium]